MNRNNIRDTYREQLLEMIEQKAAGELQEISVPDSDDDAEVVDLMAALEASVKAAKEAAKEENSKDKKSVKKSA